MIEYKHDHEFYYVMKKLATANKQYEEFGELFNDIVLDNIGCLFDLVIELVCEKYGWDEDKAFDIMFEYKDDSIEHADETWEELEKWCKHEPNE